MAEKRQKLTNLIMILTALVLFAAMLTLVVFAARSYTNAVSLQDRNSNTRSVDSYVINCVRDSEGRVDIEKRSDIECLVVEGSGYERIIYAYDGSLMEEYGEPGSSPSPDKALEIGKTETFVPEMDSSGLLFISTDEGRVCVNTEK